LSEGNLENKERPIPMGPISLKLLYLYNEFKHNILAYTKPNFSSFSAEEVFEKT
jgi:hypothetical protein